MVSREYQRTFEQRIQLLREYGEILCGARKRFSDVIGNYMETDDRRVDLERLYNTLFIIDFTFKQMFGIKTYEEACEAVANDFKKYMLDTHLNTMLDAKYIFIYKLDGVHKHNIKKIEFALYIVYNELDPQRDIIECYDWLINNNYKGRQSLIAERENILEAKRKFEARFTAEEEDSE